MGLQEKKPQTAAFRFFAAIFGAFAVLVLFLGYVETKNQKAQRKEQEFDREKYISSVNRHLQDTAQRIKQSQQAVLVDNQRSRAKPLEETNPSEYYFAPKPGSSIEDNSEADPWRDLKQRLDSASELQSRGVEAGEEIQFKLFQEQQMREWSQTYRKAYAKAFIENARKAGYEIELSEDFKVLSIRKINREAGPSIFDPVE